MLPSKQKNLGGWGNFPQHIGRIFRPEKRRDILDILAYDSALTPRGAAMSYGDAAITTYDAIDLTRLNRFIEFNKTKGLLKCEGGVTLEDILATTIPQGWLLPVIPGTKKATIGGAFACNIHGKNHYRTGELAEHVTRIKLRLANGQDLICTPSANKDLFWATAGGMGMTGIIEEITVKLTPIESCSLRARSQRVGNIHEMIDQFVAHQNHSDYMIGWIDHAQKGDKLGRGVFEYASHISVSDGGTALHAYRPTAKKITIPFFLPSFILNPLAMRFYNFLRFRRYSDIEQSEIVDFDGFFHPLDNIEAWNRLYGKRGFLQYQCLIPLHEDVAAHIHHMLHLIQSQGLFSYLAVIKFHRQSKGYMSFSQDGYSIALDFPNTHAVHRLIDDLNTYLTTLGGKVYLAKDALLSEQHFQQMYEQHDAWREVLTRHDPEARFTSSMAKRLNFKGGKNAT